MNTDVKFNIRMTEAQRLMYDRASAKEGLKLSGWIKSVLTKEARRTLGLI